MGKSTPRRRAGKGPSKPAKPHRDFPLFPHATRRWAKRILGKRHDFGPWSDPQGALERWLNGKDDLLAGREPRAYRGGPTVADLCNRFLSDKQALVQSGELAERTFQRYHAHCAVVVGTFGRNRSVSDLRPEDFQLRSSMEVRNERLGGHPRRQARVRL